MRDAHEPGESRRDDATTAHVRQAIGGDRASLSWIIERLSPLLRVQAEYRLGPAADGAVSAEDIVHEAWLKALQKLREFRFRDDRITPVIVCYLSKTVCGLATDALRRFIRSRGLPTSPREDDDSCSRSLDAFTPAAVRGVLTSVAVRESYERVKDALLGLDDDMREVVILRGIEGLSNADAAAELNLKPNTVAQRYSRARAELKRRMGQSVFDDLVDA